MDIEKLKILVAQGESELVEFKTSTKELEKAFKTACAFLNGKGGTILIGVSDKGKMTGQDISDSTQKEIATCISKLEPCAQEYIQVDYISIENGKKVIAISVAPGQQIPYAYDGRPYLRNQSTTNRMPQSQYEELIIKRGKFKYSWESLPANEYHIDALDKEEIYRTVMDGIAQKRIPPSAAKEDVENILRQLGLMEEGVLKQAAVVLYGKEIKVGSPYTQCWLKMARFRGIDKLGDFMDNQQIHCNTFQMLEEVDTFLRKHLAVSSYFKPEDPWRRVDKPTVPVKAIREALVNAMCHRDYADHAGYISVAVFDDALEIWSRGTLPGDLKIANLKQKHNSVLRNELIAKVFYLRGYIESWGTGTNHMVDWCKEDGLPAPTFEERTGGIAVTFKFAEPLGVVVKKQKGAPIHELSARQEAILSIIKKHQSVNTKQIMTELENSHAHRTIQRELNELKNLNIIFYKGKGRSATWIMKEN